VTHAAAEYDQIFRVIQPSEMFVWGIDSSRRSLSNVEDRRGSVCPEKQFCRYRLAVIIITRARFLSSVLAVEQKNWCEISGQRVDRRGSRRQMQHDSVLIELTFAERTPKAISNDDAQQENRWIYFCARGYGALKVSANDSR
jgi:hypothetical protein